jgi:acyl transferase domain-containing protein
MRQIDNNGSLEGVAIIGMAGRFPGASSVEAFWQNLVNGVDSISHFSDAELEVSNAEVSQPAYVKARGVLEGVDLFDAAYFNLTPREAELTDPQQRVFLECALEALENAGYDPDRYAGAIGVYAGCSLNTYLLHNLCANRRFIEEALKGHQMSTSPVLLGNDKDFLATRVAYKLNLRGPCVVIQTACSTSLVAVVQACQSLVSYQCDVALAGGVSISFPQKRGCVYQEGAMVSSDGRCRPFDASAEGTVFGGGVGIVVLRRLADAVEAGDHIVAVIKGFALNNDGSGKSSYMAPSANGQAEVISLAQALAGVKADTISYVEAHGTGTPLGDPIEVAGLTQAFRATTDRQQFCALGAVKGNVGHLESAAGVAGLIKTALALEHRLIPPTPHFEQPNLKCGLETSPFYVVSKLTEWKGVPLPRRAGVSAFGIGGTNAHVVLEEAPPFESQPSRRPAQLLVMSAKSAGALDRLTKNLAARLETLAAGENPAAALAESAAAASSVSPPGRSADLADIAYTLQTGRRLFKHRRAVAAPTLAEAITLLEKPEPRRVFTQAEREPGTRIAFLFPGQGAQYVNMGRQLYETEPVFREALDQCAATLQPILGLDLRSLLFPPPGNEDAARGQLNQTTITQPALFVVEYALAKLWLAWGIRPAAMVGHSVGEYVAAVLAGVMSLEDGLALLAERARLMQSMPAGGMLSVRLPELEVRPLLSGCLALAVVNSPKLCVVSGPHEELAALKATLEGRGAACKPLHTSHAFHSPMMEPLLGPFGERVGRVKLAPAQIPIISTLTGQWIQPQEWTDPSYWTRQLRHTIRFADAAASLMKAGRHVLLEVGPGQTLTTLVQQHPERPKQLLALASMPPIEEPAESVALLTALGRLWLEGVEVDWDAFYGAEQRRRLPLPTYPFERRRCWVEPPKPVSGNGSGTKEPIGSAGGSAGRPVSSGNGQHGLALPKNGQESQRSGFAPAQPASLALAEQVMDSQLRLMKSQLEALGMGRS